MTWPVSKLLWTHESGQQKGTQGDARDCEANPTIKVIPNRAINTVTLAQQTQRFIGNPSGPSATSLPPMNKETKNIHTMAIVFNLKSQSKGKGDPRYTTLS